MRIPRSIEWRAGMALLGAATTLLLLLTATTLARTDVGLELEGSIDRTREAWILDAEVSIERLNSLRRCRYAHIENGEGQIGHGPISRISGQWEQNRGTMLVQIEIATETQTGTTAADSSAQTARAILIEREKVPVLKQLIKTLFKTPKS